MRSGRFRDVLRWTVKLVLSALFVYVLLRAVGVKQLGNIPRLFSPSLWIAAIVLQTLILVLVAGSWQLLFQIQSPLTFTRALSGTLMVLFAGSFAPGRVSGRLSAPFLFRGLSREHDLPFNSAVVFVHTACYLTVYGMAGGVGVLLLRENPSVGFLLMIPVGVYLVAGLGLFALGIAAGGRRTGTPPFLIGPMKRWWETARTGASSLQQILQHRSRIGTVMVLLFLCVSFLSGLRMACFLAGAGMHVPLLTIVFLLPAMYAVTILPVSLGGVGLAEGSVVGVLTLLGGDPSVILPVVLLDRLLAVYLPSLAGWVLFLFWEGKSPPTNATRCEE